jgi:hypothetical protein
VLHILFNRSKASVLKTNIEDQFFKTNIATLICIGRFFLICWVSHILFNRNRASIFKTNIENQTEDQFF